MRTSQRQPILLDTGIITSIGNQSYSVPAGTQYIEIEMWGAGGGGGGGGKAGGRSSTTYQGGAGGGGGAYVKYRYFRQGGDLNEGDTLNFTVGEGGGGDNLIGGTNSGGDGGETSFNTVTIDGQIQFFPDPIEAGGGLGGFSAYAFGFGGDGDGCVAVGGNITNTNGEDGTNRLAPSSSEQDGRAGGFGAEPGGGAGGGGGNASLCVLGDDGGTPGGGGGGGAGCRTSPQRGGSGSDGQVIVKAFG